MGLRWVMPPPPDPYPIMLKYQLIEHCGQRLRSIADIHTVKSIIRLTGL